MRKILLFISLFITMVMMAGPVDQEAAKQKAMDFVASKMGMKAAHRSMRATNSGVRKASNRAAERDYLHVFNIDGGGYVIVSGDDRTEEILGYSLTGTFDAKNIPDNMRAFLQEYVDGIQYLDDHNIQTNPLDALSKKQKNIRRAPKTSISPLIATRWNQGLPYNLYCPLYSGYRSYSGCVATALAQVMAYHKWPAATTTMIPAYTTDTRGMSCSSIPAGTTIDWANMQNIYNSSSSLSESTATAAEKAVANLLKLCGYSVQMDYFSDNYGSSGAQTSDCIIALIKYFDYEEETCKFLKRTQYSYNDWQDIIYAELAAKRPVLYSGQSAGGGHAFVCDGYETDDFFHINWGWGGMSDNYFRLRLLNPDDQGAGGSSTNDGYGMGQGIGIGIQKNDGTSSGYVEKISMYNLVCSETAFTRSSSTENFNFNSSITYYVNNSTGNTKTFELGARILNSSGQEVEDLGTLFTRTLSNNYMTGNSYIPAFGANYANGKYKLVFMARNSGDTEWYVCEKGETMCIDFTISDNTLTIAAPKLSVTHDIVGNYTSNTEHTIKLNITNTGSKAFRNDLKYEVNGNNKWYRAGFIDAEPNATTTVEFKYTPTTSGTYSFKFDPLDYSFSMVIDPGSSADLKGTYTSATPPILYDNSKDLYYVNGNSTTASFTIQNAGGAAYNNNIGIVYWYYSISEKKWKQHNVENRQVSIAAGSTQTLSVVIDKVNDSDYGFYCVETHWYNNGEWLFLAGTPEFEFRGTSVNYKIEANDIGSDPALKYNSTAYQYFIEGNEATFYIDIKNTGTDVFSGQVMIEQAYHVAGGGSTWKYKDYPTYPEYRDVTIAAGGTQRLYTTLTKSTDPEVDLYFVRVKYMGSNESEFETLKYTPNFAMIEANQPCLTFQSMENTPQLIYDSSVGHYYVESSKLTSTFSITNIGTAAYSGQVRFRFWGHNQTKDKWEEIKSASTQDFSLNAGATGKASETIEKTENYDLYSINCFYIDQATNKEIFIRRTSDFEFRTSTKYVIESGDYGCTPEMQYDSNTKKYYIMGDEATFYIDIKNTGGAAFSGQVMVEQAYHRAGGGSKWYYKDYPTYPEYRDVTIAAGGTNRLYTTITKSTDPEVDMYFIRIKYQGSNESEFVTLEYTPNFAMIGNNDPYLTIKDVTTSPLIKYDSSNDVYYAEGEQLKATFNISNIGNKAFNGQAKFYYWGSPDGEDWDYIKSETTQNLSVAAGASTSVSATIEKTTNDIRLYCIELFYVDESGNEIFLKSTADFEFREGGGNIPGDVNGDGVVNVTDIVATVNYIMEKPSDGFNKEAADLNGDGEINVTDIVKMVTIIMSGGGGSSRRAAATSSKLLISGHNIQLRNAENYIAAQFDINLSDGETISNIVLNGSSNHDLHWKMIDANTCRVVVYSMTNTAFRANGDNLFNIFINGGQRATISNEILIKGENTTGIDAIRKEAEDGKVYDLNGRQVNTPRKGVYIINGKKVVVK